MVRLVAADTVEDRIIELQNMRAGGSRAGATTAMQMASTKVINDDSDAVLFLFEKDLEAYRAAARLAAAQGADADMASAQESPTQGPEPEGVATQEAAAQFAPAQRGPAQAAHAQWGASQEPPHSVASAQGPAAQTQVTQEAPQDAQP